MSMRDLVLENSLCAVRYFQVDALAPRRVGVSERVLGTGHHQAVAPPFLD